jgi:hypothetical protein
MLVNCKSRDVHKGNQNWNILVDFIIFNYHKINNIEWKNIRFNKIQNHQLLHANILYFH